MVTILSSKGERLIHQYLEYLDIPFEEEYIFSDLTAENGKPLRFDFCLFDDDGNIDALIEFNGRQHYIALKKFGGSTALARQKHNDQRKREYCLKNDYRLITIPYTEEDNLSPEYLANLIYGY